MVISNKTLGKIAVYGGIFVATSAMLMRDSIIQRIKREEYYKEALKLLRAHPGKAFFIYSMKVVLKSQKRSC